MNESIMKILVSIIVGIAFVGGLTLMQGCVVRERDTVVRDHDDDHHDADHDRVVVHDDNHVERHD